MASGPVVFDRAAVRRNLRRAQKRGPATFLIDRTAEDLCDRLSAVLRRFELAVDLASPTDAVRRRLRGTDLVSTIIAVMDPSADAPARDDDLKVVADAEALPLREDSLDLVVSALALQFVNDLPGTFVQVRRALKPDGLFLAALIGGDSLIELRQAFAAAEAELEHGASPHVAPFADVRAIGMLLQRAGFALPVADVERLGVRYESPFALMQDLRRMGAANALAERRRTPLRRSTMLRMAEIYAERFCDPDGRVRATFDIVWLSGWKPHPSQQQPLSPGSAKARLADALGTREIPAGDKARR
ncbi:MAG TPA: methyltransferase domain-containing protein [Xanthobacteraceae bacterium]|nr:methyltransferase domain-containing protein [Xanthobacteraceae bacterium]